MAGWMKRKFSSYAVTEYPAGPNLAKVGEQFQPGYVELCIDCSYSMGGEPFVEALAGARQFSREAFAGGYAVGLVLWNHGVERCCPPAKDQSVIAQMFDTAAVGGGTDIVPTLEKCLEFMTPLPPRSDRVVVIFGDGDLGSDVDLAKRHARALQDRGVRIMTIGLGAASAAELSVIASEDAGGDYARTASVESLARDLGGIATVITRAKRKR